MDNDLTTFTAGYNYALNRADTLGVFYRFSAYHFSGEPQAFGDHSFNLAYGKKLTGKLALQLYAGPDFTTSRVVVSNTDSLTYGVNVGANLSYGFQKGTLFANYSHGVSGGSGVLTGSTGDQIHFGANHQLSRLWTGQFQMGYSHNAPVAAGTNSQTYNTWNVGGGASRPFGRNANFSVNYTATIADYGLATCVGAACSSTEVYHYVTLSFQWHTRPFILP